METNVIATREKNTPAKNNTKSEHIKIAVFFGLALLFAMSIFIAFLQLRKVSLVNLQIAGMPTGRGSPNNASVQKLESLANNYHFSVRYPGGNAKSFNLQSAGLTPDIPSTLNKAKQFEQQLSPWKRWQFWRTQNINLVFKTDEDKLNTFINQEATVVKTPVTDASLHITNGQVTLKKSTNGRGHTVPGGKDGLVHHLSQLSNEPIRLSFQSLPPVIRSASLHAVKVQAESILARNFTFVVYGKEIKATPGDIGEWLVVKPNPTAQTAELNVSGDKILEFIGRITKPYAYSARSQVVFTLPDGSKVSLSPSYGELNGANKAAVSNMLATAISSGQDVKTELAINYAASNQLNYSYDKWIAVDLTAKRMYAYEKTNLVRTFLVSAGAPSTPTTPGFHKIYSKVRRQDMRGPNADGSSYFQPNVEYVNYFYGGEAIHGNYWRPVSYFGNINSSHGCVGIVNSDAAWVYAWAPVGTPVITYN